MSAKNLNKVSFFLNSNSNKYCIIFEILALIENFTINQKKKGLLLFSKKLKFIWKNCVLFVAQRNFSTHTTTTTKTKYYCFRKKLIYTYDIFVCVCEKSYFLKEKLTPCCLDILSIKNFKAMVTRTRIHLLFIII